MARSRKKPFVKDKGNSHEYWRVIRREWKQQLHKNWDDEDLHLRLPQEIVNDYDYSDYRWLIYVSEEHIKHPDRKHEEYWGSTYDYVKLFSRK
jgi:hypothetical protein